LGLRFLRAQITVHLIVLPTVALEYFLLHRFRQKKKPVVMGIAVSSGIVLATGLAFAFFFGLEAIYPGFFRSDYPSSLRFVMVVILITIILSFIGSEIEYKELASQGQNAYFSALVQGKTYRISHRDILYVQSQGNYSLIYTASETLKLRKNLNQISSELPPPAFQRVHKQFLLNIEWISHLQYQSGGTYLCYLKDEDETPLPVGRKYAADLKKTIR